MINWEKSILQPTRIIRVPRSHDKQPNNGHDLDRGKDRISDSTMSEDIDFRKTNTKGIEQPNRETVGNSPSGNSMHVADKISTTATHFLNEKQFIRDNSPSGQKIQNGTIMVDRELKIKDGQNKSILRDTFREMLPQSIIEKKFKILGILDSAKVKHFGKLGSYSILPPKINMLNQKSNIIICTLFSEDIIFNSLKHFRKKGIKTYKLYGKN